MIIKFSEEITLGEWELNTNFHYPPWQRRQVKSLPDITSGVTVWNYCSDFCNINFFGKLYFLTDYFSGTYKGDFDLTKDYVDKILIRMSKLKAFY
jgi:hypothetical protein